MNTDNQIQHLLKPRWICTNDFPFNNIPVGNIIREDEDEEELYYFLDKKGEKKWTCKDEIDFDKYPANFRRLDWWEHLEVEEMPEYLKETEPLEGGGSIIYVYKNRKDFKYLTGTNVIGLKMVNDKRMIHIQYLEPATEQQYLEYTKLKK